MTKVCVRRVRTDVNTKKMTSVMRVCIQVTVNSSSEFFSQESNSNVDNFNVTATKAWFPLNRNNCVFILGLHLFHYNFKVVVQSAKLYQIDG